MKNLYQKLTEENKNKLFFYKQKFPTITNNLIEVLQKKEHWTDLKVIQMFYLFDALEIKDFYFTKHLDNLFNVN